MAYVLLRETFPVARKQYRCIWCGEVILAGQKYRHEISKYDEMQDHRWHLECNKASRDYFEYECEFLPYENERPT